MSKTYSKSSSAQRAYTLVQSLQDRFVQKLEQVSSEVGSSQRFEATEWLREGGRYGGGVRYGASGGLFNRASVNVSQVHYDDNPEKALGSASAISTIIHPQNPHAPSVHIHISWTEMKGGKGYWRIMADLNPSIPYDEDKATYAGALKDCAGDRYAEGAAQGDRYFFIPALDRHRGVTHFYLESYSTDDAEADYQLAESMGIAAIDTYVAILLNALKTRESVTEADRQQQREYHSLYLLQVLTLDRGTTSGLLVHDENDVGILGSLPSHVSASLLKSWVGRMFAPQDKLLEAIVAELPTDDSELTSGVKKTLAVAVRNHYLAYPKALDMQASGNVVPPTVVNHK